jgi:hypothetical protein
MSDGGSARGSSLMVAYAIAGVMLAALWVGATIGAPILRGQHGTREIVGLLNEISSSGIFALIVLTVLGFGMNYVVVPGTSGASGSGALSTLVSLVLWLAIAGLLLFLFKHNEFTARDRRLIDNVIDLGPTILLVLTWAVAMFVLSTWIGRRRPRE